MKVPEDFKADFLSLVNSVTPEMWVSESDETTLIMLAPPLFPEHDDENQPGTECQGEEPLVDEAALLSAVKKTPELLIELADSWIMVSAIASSIRKGRVEIGPAHAGWFLFLCDTPDPAKWHYTLAAELLKGEPDLGDSDKWRVRLGEAIWMKCKGFADRLKKDGVAFNARAGDDGRVLQAQVFCDYLKSIKTKEARAVIGSLGRRDKPVGWELFKPQQLADNSRPFPAFALTLGSIALKDEIKPAWTRVQKNQPAIPAVVVGRTEEILGWRGRTEVKGNKLINADGIEVATLTEDVATAIASLNTLCSLTGHRVVRHLIMQAHERYFAGDQRWDELDYSQRGGIEAFAESIGASNSSERQKQEIRDILRAGQSFRMTLPGSGEIGGLWTYQCGKRGDCEIKLSNVLSPHFNLRLKVRDRNLVPMVPIPPLLNPDKKKKNQAAFQFGFVRKLVEGRREIKERGGIIMSQTDWAKHGKAYDLNSDEVRAVIDRWQHDGDDGERVLEFANGVWHLADNETYGAARRFIDDGARCGERKKARMTKGKQLREIESV